jgi:hypothetical protein
VRVRQGGEVALIIYTHVSKCKNDKIKFKKRKEKDWWGGSSG